MDAIDPHLQEIMAKLNNKNATPQSATKEDEEKKAEAVTKPPTTFEQFLKTEHLEEWPQRLTSENKIDLSQERDSLGNLKTIGDELKEATPIDLQVLKNLEKRLDSFDDNLLKYARMVLDLTKVDDAERDEDMKTISTEKDHFPLSVNRAFLTQMAESDAVKAHPSRKQKDFLETKGSLAETRKKSVEHCKFPGYLVGELTDLPSQLEAPHILHRITKAQDFNAGFRKFWKKIFLSEASVAMMQDSFWWIFLEKFQNKIKDTEINVIYNFSEPNYKEQQSKLFDRIADSYVALFASVNPEIKDKVLLVYADCLAQCIYAAFYEAFPESIRLFQDDFKQYLVSVTSTWILGVKPAPGAAKHWDLKRMLPKALRNMEDSVAKARREMTVHGPMVHKLDMDDFMKQVDQLGNVESDKPHVSKVVIQAIQGYGQGVSREATKMTNQTVGSRFSQAVSTFPTVTASRAVQIGSPREKRESHVIGPGAELERAKFNLKGKSPLVAHYLYMHQLQHNKPHGGKVIQRTEVAKLPDSNLPTYRDLISETLEVQDTLSKEYQRVCEDTNQEIMKIERQQRDTNRKIAKLQKELASCKNSMEVKIMSERILEKQDMNSQKFAIKEEEEDV